MQSQDVSGGRMQSVIILVFLSLFIVSLGLVIKRVYVDRDYLLVSEVVCDPEFEACFARVCEEECEEGEEGVVDYYKIRTVSASEVLLCDPNSGECPEVSCSELTTCSEEFCNEENVPEGEECSEIPTDEESEQMSALELGEDSDTAYGEEADDEE